MELRAKFARRKMTLRLNFAIHLSAFLRRLATRDLLLGAKLSCFHSLIRSFFTYLPARDFCLTLTEICSAAALSRLVCLRPLLAPFACLLVSSRSARLANDSRLKTHSLSARIVAPRTRARLATQRKAATVSASACADFRFSATSAELVASRAVNRFSRGNSAESPDLARTSCSPACFDATCLLQSISGLFFGSSESKTAVQIWLFSSRLLAARSVLA